MLNIEDIKRLLSTSKVGSFILSITPMALIGGSFLLVHFVSFSSWLDVFEFHIIGVFTFLNFVFILGANFALVSFAGRLFVAARVDQLIVFMIIYGATIIHMITYSRVRRQPWALFRLLRRKFQPLFEDRLEIFRVYIFVGVFFFFLYLGQFSYYMLGIAPLVLVIVLYASLAHIYLAGPQSKRIGVAAVLRRVFRDFEFIRLMRKSAPALLLGAAILMGMARADLLKDGEELYLSTQSGDSVGVVVLMAESGLFVFIKEEGSMKFFPNGSINEISN